MKFKIKKSVFFSGILSLPLFAFGQVEVPGKLGKGIAFTASDSSFSARLNARFQTLYMGEYNLDSEGYSDGITIRRARLKFDGFVFSPKLEYKIELGLSNQDISGATAEQSNTANIVLDAVGKWNFAPGFSLWFGQAKLPGNRERVVSSQKLQFVDRSLLNSRFNLDRDLGVQLHHESKLGTAVFRQIASLSMGEGRNITSGNAGGYDFTGRLEFLPLGTFMSDGDYVGGDISREPAPRLSVGLTYDFNTNASRERGQLGSFFEARRDLKTLFADAMFKYRGFSAMAEYADRQTIGSPVVASDIAGNVTQAFFTGTAFNIQAGYLFGNDLELAGRYTTIKPEAVTQRDKNQQYTLGVSRYFSGHTLKLQSDISLLKEAGDFSEVMYRLQVEIGF